MPNYLEPSRSLGGLPRARGPLSMSLIGSVDFGTKSAKSVKAHLLPAELPKVSAASLLVEHTRPHATAYTVVPL